MTFENDIPVIIARLKHCAVLFLSNASDLTKQYAYGGDNLPTLGDVYHIAAKHNLILNNLYRITENYVYVGRGWMRNFLERSAIKGAVFSEEFNFAVKGYLQLVPAFALSNKQGIQSFQITLEKIKCDPSVLY